MFFTSLFLVFSDFYCHCTGPPLIYSTSRWLSVFFFCLVISFFFLIFVILHFFKYFFVFNKFWFELVFVVYFFALFSVFFLFFFFNFWSCVFLFFFVEFLFVLNLLLFLKFSFSFSVKCFPFFVIIFSSWHLFWKECSEWEYMQIYAQSVRWRWWHSRTIHLERGALLPNNNMYRFLKQVPNWPYSLTFHEVFSFKLRQTASFSKQVNFLKCK